MEAIEPSTPQPAKIVAVGIHFHANNIPYLAFLHQIPQLGVQFLSGDGFLSHVTSSLQFHH
jgi:hypothetical protein